MVPIQAQPHSQKQKAFMMTQHRDNISPTEQQTLYPAVNHTYNTQQKEGTQCPAPTVPQAALQSTCFSYRILREDLPLRVLLQCCSSCPTALCSPGPALPASGQQAEPCGNESICFSCCLHPKTTALSSLSLQPPGRAPRAALHQQRPSPGLALQ